MTKPIIPTSRKGFRPKRSPSFPAIGVRMVEVAASLSGQLDEHDPPISRILETPDETLARERVDELGERGRRHRAALCEITASHRALAKLPHHPGAVRRHVAVLAACGRGHLDQAQSVQEKSRELEVFGLRGGMTLDQGGHCGSDSK